ncbi:MAG TPA: tetratricopeptide repeat protein [Rhizomicrobium sp.]|nr:tetratricopeptide repeat protein [Rhizomicrobium sp.]
MKRSLQAALLLCAPLAICGAAVAQTAVSYSAVNNLAHDCYVAALTAAKTGMRPIATDALSTCDAALNSPLNLRDRAATFDNRGILHDTTQDWSAAWSDFDASIRLNPELGDAWLNRGVSLIRMKERPEEALSNIQHGVELGPSLPQVGYYDLGVAQQSLGHAAEAYAAYKRALSVDPSFAPAAEALKNFRVVPAGA